MSKELMSLEERIADKVGNELIDLIPEEQWKTLVATQVNHFKQYKLPEIVERILIDELKLKVKEQLNSPDFAIAGDKYGHTIASEMVKKMIEEGAGPMMANIFGEMVHRQIDMLRGSYM